MLMALLSVPVLTAALVQWRYDVLPIVSGMLRRHAQASIAMVLLIAIATAVNILFSIQEHSVRQASAAAANPFDLIIAAPGSQVDSLMATVYLQASALPLLEAHVLDELQARTDIDFAAPVGFGDRIDGYPLVGTTEPLISHLVGLTGKRWFSTTFQLVAGSKVPGRPGDVLVPRHGMNADDDDTHSTVSFEIVSRLSPTGTRWDHAYIAPIEALWQLHGSVDHGRTPAIVVSTTETAALYDIRQAFNSQGSMAFFPAEVLARLYTVLSSVDRVIGWLTLVTQLLVVSAVLLGVFILMRTLSLRFATLYAMGAPAAFRFWLVWFHTASLILAGVCGGVLLGLLAAGGLSAWASELLQIPFAGRLRQAQLIETAWFLDITLLLAVVPAWLVARRQGSVGLFV